MNNRWQDEHAALKAELARLQQKLRELEATCAAPSYARACARWRPSRAALWWSVALAALLLPAGLIYGENAIEALFIDANGNVGIGTLSPKAALDVNGSLNVAQKITAAEVEVQGALRATKGGNLADLNIQGSLTGPKTRLQVVGEAKAGSEVLSLRNLSTGYEADKGVYQSYYVGNHNDAGGNEMARILGANKTEGGLANGYLAFATRTSDKVTEKLRIDDVSIAAGVPLRVEGELQAKKGLRVEGGLLVTPVKDAQGVLPFRMSWPARDPSKSEPRTVQKMPLDPYCSDDDGCNIRIRAESYNTAKPFFMVSLDVAVSSGGPKVARSIYMRDVWGEARCWSDMGCDRWWLDRALKVIAKNNDLSFETDGRMGLVVTVYDH
jgi:hypothetical protein